jgi:hypothetical protein
VMIAVVFRPRWRVQKRIRLFLGELGEQVKEAVTYDFPPKLCYNRQPMSLSLCRRFLFLIIGLALVLRLWQIDQLPPGFHFDEAFEGVEAWRILTDPTYRPIFITGNFGVLPLNVYANTGMFALVTWLGGSAGPTAMRLTAALFGVVGVLTLYALAGELRHLTQGRIQLSPAFPLLAAATLAIMRWHIHFSRMGIEPILVPLLWTGATWLFLRGYRRQGWISFVGSAFCLAAAMYTYLGAWIIPLLMIPTCVWLLIWSRGSEDAIIGDLSGFPNLTDLSAGRRLFMGAILTAGVALLLVAPLGWFMFQNPDLILLRPAQLSIVGATESPADSGLGAALWATAKMFGPVGTPGDLDPRRNVPGLPALSPWLALPFYLGLLLALRWVSQPAYALPLIGLVGLLLPGVFSEYAPHFHRILGAAAPAALLCGIGLDRLWQWRIGRFAWTRVVRWGAIGLLGLGGISESYSYFVTWARLPDLFYAFDVGLWQMGQTIAAQPATTQVYLTPRSADHPTLAFAWTIRKDAHGNEAHVPVTFDGRNIFPFRAQTTGTDPPSTVDLYTDLYAVIEHEDFRTPLLLPSLFPTATVSQEIQDSQGELYARFYQRPLAMASQRLPQQSQQATLGDGIDLVGYDVQPAALKAGEILYLQLYWAVTAAPTADWTVFTHLVQRDDQGKVTVVAGRDSQPGAGSLPTQRWQPGWQILDEYQIPLPSDLAAGEYELAIGLYQPSGERLPAAAEGLFLGKVTID